MEGQFEIGPFLLEDLRDILDMLEAMKEPRRSLDKYLAEVNARN